MRILIVEDEREIRDLLQRSFVEERYAVDVARDGEEGVRLARNNSYDVIVLDNLLPKKNGIDVCRELRKAGLHIPILILSVQSETTTKIDLLNAGADDYLAKPFSFQELAARVRALMRRPAVVTGDELEIGALILNVQKHTVHAGSKELSLTRKEFMLLEYLMRNVGNPLSRMMIMEHVWDVTSDPFSNTIETHVTTLRRKLEKAGLRNLIQTIPGVGYRIVNP